MAIEKFYFHCPFTSIVAGPTGSGKTHLVFALITHKDQLFKNNLAGIMYCYNTYQSKFQQYKDTIEFVEGMPSKTVLEEFRNKKCSNEKENILVIIDDLIVGYNI